VRASAETAAAPIPGVRFSRLRGTRCGAGILKTVRFVTNLYVSHTVRISTARQQQHEAAASQPTGRLPDRWRAGPGRSRASSRLPRSAGRARRSNANRIRRRPTSYERSQAVKQTFVRLRRAAVVFVRCTVASHIKQRTVRQALFIPL